MTDTDLTQAARAFPTEHAYRHRLRPDGRERFDFRRVPREEAFLTDMPLP